MAGISVSGLVSGSFDWQSVVDQLIAIESRPIARLQTEQSTNIDKIASLTVVKNGLQDLQTAAKALSVDGLFNGRTATSSTSGSTWTGTAANGIDTGSYTIAVSQLATTAQRVGASSISSSLNAAATDLGTDPDGIAGLTLASLPTTTAITSGDSIFTINGHQITINSADSLQSVFDEISTATGGEVTASYDAGTDKVTLSSAGEIVLGAANDTSNFLSVMRLANNGTGSISSSSALGAVSLTASLASSRLVGSLAGVDGEGNGTFAINGVSIGYNVNDDSIADVLARITASSAGVTATYDRYADRVVLTNKTTGDTGISAADTAGGLAAALGLTTGATLQRGKDALFTVNGGDTLRSTSNTLSATALGVTGLSVTVDSETTQTINVAANTTAMKTAIQDFLTKFNAVRTTIDEETAITKQPDGTIKAATLASNREVEGWSSRLRSLAFSQISGLTGTIQRLEDLGIDFNSTGSELSIQDEDKLDAALTNNAADVTAFFNTSTTGFSAVFDSYLTATLDTQSGSLASQVNSLNKQNTGIEDQIDTLNRRLDEQREQLTNAFLAMQKAQSQAEQQQKTLENMLKKSSDS